MKYSPLIILGLGLLVLGAGCTKETKTTESETSVIANRTSTVNTNTDEALPSGAVLVQAETGELLNKGAQSFVSDTVGGGEAYLGDGSAAVMYSVSVPAAGKYVLSVRLNDDGKHVDGARSATVTQRDQTLTYTHVSENIVGWKWFNLGNLYLVAGENVLKFTKDKTTSAAFVMDSFKLVPVK